MKWLTDTDHHRRVVDALARAFDLLGLPRYAALCRSEATAEVLEFAVASGELVPGARGGRQRQEELVRAQLRTPRIELDGQTWLDGATDTGAPPTEHDIRSGWHLATNLLRALNLLSIGGGWQDRSYGLTPAGRAVALECLHHRATGPRSSPGAETSASSRRGSRKYKTDRYKVASYLVHRYRTVSGGAWRCTTGMWQRHALVTEGRCATSTRRSVWRCSRSGRWWGCRSSVRIAIAIC